MYLQIFVLSVATMLISEVTSASTSAFTSADELTVHLCTANQTLSAQIQTRSGDTAGNTCTCQIGPTRGYMTREDYVHTPGIGSHKLHTDAKSWNVARKICNDESAHLAIINSEAEEAKLVEMLSKAESQVKDAVHSEEALLGIHDLYTEGEWVTIFGESLQSTGYSKWHPTYYGGQPDNFENRQHCGAIIKYGSMDDVDCREKFAFICELPLTC